MLLRAHLTGKVLKTNRKHHAENTEIAEIENILSGLLSLREEIGFISDTSLLY